MYLINEVNTLALNQLRLRGERNIVICEGTARVLRTIHTKGNGNIDRSAVHRTGGIHNSQGIQVRAIEVISQVGPVLVYHSAIGGIIRPAKAIAIAVVTDMKRLLNNFIGIQSTRVYLGIGVLGERFVLLLDDIATSKSVLINQTRLRRNLIELDFIPLRRV